MAQDKRGRTTKFRKSWLLIVFACVGIFLFRQPLLLIGCKCALAIALPKTEGRVVSYEGIQWEQEAIVIAGLNILDSSSEIKVDRIELKLSGDWTKLCFTPHISVIHPLISVTSSGSNPMPALPFLYRTAFFQPRWTVEKGELQLGSTFYFSLIPGDAQEEIGCVRLACHADPLVDPLLTANIAVKNRNLYVDFRLQADHLSELLPLTSLLFSDVRRQWESVSGQAELEGFVSLGAGLEVREFALSGSAKKIALIGPKMGIELHCAEAEGSLALLPEDGKVWVWDRLAASLQVEKIDCAVSTPLSTKAYRLSDVYGQIAIEPQKEPHIALKGAIADELQVFAFHLDGKGGIQEDATLWSELAVDLSHLGSQPMQAHFSLCKHAESTWAMRTKIDNAGSAYLNFFSAFAHLPGTCTSGSLSAETTLLFQERRCHSLTLDHFACENMRWVLPEINSAIIVARAAGDGAFVLNSQGDWTLENLHLQMQEGDYLAPQVHLTQIAANATVERGVLQASTFRGQGEGLTAEVTCLGSDADHLADVKIEGDAGALLARWCQKRSLTPLPISLRIATAREGNVLALEGEGAIAGEAFQTSLSVLSSPGLLSALLAGSAPTVALSEGVFLAERLTEKSYGAILTVLMPEAKIEGNLRCEALFSASRVQFKVTADELRASHPLGELTGLKIHERPAQFFYDIASQEWRGEIPLAGATLKARGFALPVQNIEGTIKWEEDCIKAPALYAEVEGLALRGGFEFDTIQQQLVLHTSQMAGEVQGLLRILTVLPDFSKCAFDISGYFSSGEQGLVLCKPLNGDLEWSFKGNFEQLAFPFNAATSIAEGSCTVVADSKTQRVSVENAQGLWKLKSGIALTVQVPQLRGQWGEENSVDFSLKVVDGKKEFLQLQGKASQTRSSNWDVAFDARATHFGGVPLHIQRCLLREDGGLAALELKPIIKCKDLRPQVAFLNNVGFSISSALLQNIDEWQLDGTLETRIFSEDFNKGFSFEAESGDLKIHGQSWPKFHVQGQRVGEQWLIEKYETNGLMLKGTVAVDTDGFSLPHWEGNWKGMAMKGSGFVKSSQKRFYATVESIKGDLSHLPGSLPTSTQGTFIAALTFQGDFSDLEDPLRIQGEASVFAELRSPIAIAVNNKKKVQFSYGKKEGLMLSGIDLQLKHKWSGAFLADIQAERQKVGSACEFSLSKVAFSIAPALLGYAIDAGLLPTSLRELDWEGYLEGSGELKVSSSGPLFHGTLKPGRYGFKEKSLSIEHLQVRWENQLLSIRAKTQIEQQPLWAALQVDCSQEPFGMLKLFDHPKAEGMKCLFHSANAQWTLDSIQGSCYGLNCSLVKTEKRTASTVAALTGEVQVDGNRLAHLLPKEIRDKVQQFQFGNGYLWEGDLHIAPDDKLTFTASGMLKGKNFELLGYRLRKLEATLQASPQHIVLTNLKIEDAAGSAVIPKIALNKEEEWHLDIPRIQIRQLQPSAMRKVNANASELKPFIIEHLTLNAIHARLSDISSLQGTGSLQFVNQFKKEVSILDIPLEMIKKIGLDLGLLTPVQGEVQMELRGDKFYLVSLDNAFSEGERAEFYLSPERDLSYIDLSGKVHIDLRMRQDVVLKITEPFTLTIRGTLDKPRYGLQF